MAEDVMANVRRVELPHGYRDLLGFEVMTDLMAPIFGVGDVVYVSPKPLTVTDVIGEEAIARLSDGTMLLRTVESGGPGGEASLATPSGNSALLETADCYRIKWRIKARVSPPGWPC